MDVLGGRCVWLSQTMTRVLPPLLSTLFERDVALYRSLALFVRGLEIAVSGGRWVLGRRYGKFETEGSNAIELAEALKGNNRRRAIHKRRAAISENKAQKLVEPGLPDY